MVKSAKDVIEMAYRLDNLKKYIGSIKRESARIAFSDDSFSLFPLYYLTTADIKEEVVEYEPVAIRAILQNDFNADRINTIIATTARNDVWISPMAFDMFVDAANGATINPEVLSPDLAEELIIGMINISGIEGALAMPFKTDVLGFIKASLDFDGWDIPPLPLMFENITNLYEGKEDRIDEIKSMYGSMSLEDITKVDNLKKISAENDPSLANYFVRNQEVAEHVLNSFKKTMFDWTTIINGG